MSSSLRPALMLFAGDLFFFVLSLWLALFVRSFAELSANVFEAHLIAFAPLFVVWAIVFLIAGLYEWRRFLLARRMLSSTLLRAQSVNVLIAAIFFFLIPLFGIAPKTVLVIYLAVSFVLILLWRAFLFPKLITQEPEPALLIGEGKETEELMKALQQARLSPMRIIGRAAPKSPSLLEEVQQVIEVSHPQAVIAHIIDPKAQNAFSLLYNRLSSSVRFIDLSVLYEELFGRIPLSVLNDVWLMRNISHTHKLYDPLKRLMDMVVGGILAVLSLLLYPFVIFSILAEGRGPIFIVQERIGEGNRPIRLYKFRSMTGNDHGEYGSTGTTKLQVTKVGKILRATRLDELPQLWNILRGDLSLIGPRPELPALVVAYEKEIPYYGLRHRIKPGLSGWAQLYHDNHPHHGTDVEATREKLSYDLYYLKHRSLTLDAVIALKTIKKMVTKSGV